MANVVAASKTEGILQTCKACAHEFRAPQKLLGKEMPCPYCRRTMLLSEVKVVNEDRLVGREIAGCILLQRLGAGALGVVYAADQKAMERKVAIKMLSSKAATEPETVTRFQREARLCAQIKHPNVVGVYDCGHERGVHFLLMELVEGGTFAGLIEEHGHLSWHDTFAYGMQIARALEHLHSTDVIHRDIKPANVLITYDGAAKLADLGLAKQLGAEEVNAATGLTMQGVAMGSPAYMPPEQIRSAKDSTASCDLYALGASMFQALTGKLPFDGRSATEVMGKVLRDPAPLVSIHDPTIPAGVVELIDRLLSKDPKGRPASATALIADMEAVLQDPNRVHHGNRLAAKNRHAMGSTAGNPLPVMTGLPTIAKVVIGVSAVLVLVFIYLVFKGP
jgi:serine/threonine protein kinase